MILYNCFTSNINRLLQWLVWTFTREMWYVNIKESLLRKRSIKRLGKLKDSYEFLIHNDKTGSEDTAALLGVKIDSRLNFEKHVTGLCPKACRQCHAYIITLDLRKWKCYLTVLSSQISTIASLCGISALPLCHRKWRNTGTCFELIVYW